MNILLTGVSRGIGAEIKRQLSAQGHRVVGISRIVELGSGDITADLGMDLNYALLFQTALDKVEGGHFDVLINNAGICDHISFEDMGMDEWIAQQEGLFQINYFSATNLTKVFVGDILQRKVGGKVISMCSRVAIKGQADAPSYAASKAALLTFSRSLAIRYAKRGIALYTICPSWVKTDMAKGSIEEMSRDIPAGTIATVEDVAVAVRYLVNDATQFQSGLNMDINGASLFH